MSKALALVLLSAPLLAHAGSKIATSTMQVSFIVTESCNVQSAAVATAQRPAVSCQLNTPYQVNRSADKTAAPAAATAPAAAVNAAPLRTETGAQDWTIYF
ncbi:hypothetical protein [Rugamonas aquatica]|uniref:DUF680 domain-containing protein n=1 Tax=Rugamonas aquatica TaxID=2743357 RepID=A0A6A7N8E9_9BURK|nr:hypothetical protein [Rugamonas aquatica]MQA41370.1 hypothetical protein [Rugamonas aquatica]